MTTLEREIVFEEKDLFISADEIVEAEGMSFEERLKQYEQWKHLK